MTSTAATPPSARIASIDLLRGLVMVFMLLDHTRDFVHVDARTRDPMDPATTDVALFFTRWITHFCAPVFVLLAGVGVHLQRRRGAEPARLAGALWRRGVFFVLLELVVLRPLIWFQLDPRLLAFLQVIWAIGWAMLGLALLVRLRAPTALVAAIGLAIVGGHNLLPHDPFTLTTLSSWEGLRVLLFGRGFLGVHGKTVIVQYAIVPWLGVMLCGYALGALYARPAVERRRWLLVLGAAATFAFVVLRTFSAYGNPAEWEEQLTSQRDVFAFLHVEKYPPSLQYLLMTLGPALVLLALAERVRADGAWRVVVALGRVPLFFYVLQWPLVHVVSRLFQWIDGQPMGWDAPTMDELVQPVPRGCGFSLGGVYVAFAVGLAVLVPLSVWFARWRQRHPNSRWLRYL